MVSELSIVIPAYNEEKRILPVLNNYLSFFRKKGINFEILVACNNCSDSTPELVGEMARKNSEITVLNFPFYTGKGGAVLRGFSAAKKDIVAFVDADSSTSPEQFFRIYNRVAGSGFDAAIGSRAISGSVVEKKQPFLRILAARSYSLIVETLFGLGIPDTQCGAKAFKKTVVDAVLPSLKSSGWEFDVELLWKIKRKNFSIMQVPIQWNDAEYTRFSFRAVPSMFLQLVKRRMGL